MLGRVRNRIRNPNIEIRNKFKILNLNAQNALYFEHSYFDIVSDFEFRASDL